MVLVDLRAGGLGMIHFTTLDRKRVVLMLRVVNGPLGAMAWRSNSQGTPIAGIADGAWVKASPAVIRVAETTIVLTPLGRGKGRTEHYPHLMRPAAARAASAEPAV